MAAYSQHLPLSTPLTYIGLCGIGALVMRGAGCTINDMWDKNLDRSVGTFGAARLARIVRQLRHPLSLFSATHRKDEATADCCWHNNASRCVHILGGTACCWTGCASPVQLVQVRVASIPLRILTHFVSSILLGASSLSLVTIYPLMKRITYWPQAVLGLSSIRLAHTHL